MTDTRQWLEQHGLGKYAQVFADNELTLEILPDLTEDDLRELDLPMGPRKQLLKAIATLTSSEPETGPVPTKEAERRHLTVMFCDLAGSTALSERFDPEDFGEIVRAYQHCCAGIISPYEGYIARYMGDGILVYFGYPQAHEDDAERALRAGLEIIETVPQLETRPGLSLEVRVGVATGPVVVGETIGEGSSQEQVVVGETPNLAARLQSLAQPNTLVISPATQRLTAKRFEYVSLGKHELKGFAEPVEAWAVSRLRDEDAMASPGGGASGLMVGRGQELELLRARWAMAQGGAGQAVLLSGEPGVGKTRLLEAVRAEVAREGVTRGCPKAS
jgi:class 3 adenylate cyclase